MQSFVKKYIDDLDSVLMKLDQVKIAEAIEMLRAARDEGRTIYVCGNGGIAFIASHFVTDVVKGASLRKKTRFKIIGLTDNIGTITAYGNDEGYESIFVEQLKNFAKPGDVLIAISGSGNSPNVLRAVKYATEVGCKTIGMTTADGGKLREMTDLALLAPGCHMGRLEDAFAIMTHILAYAFIEAD